MQKHQKRSQLLFYVKLSSRLRRELKCLRRELRCLRLRRKATGPPRQGAGVGVGIC